MKTKALLMKTRTYHVKIYYYIVQSLTIHGGFLSNMKYIIIFAKIISPVNNKRIGLFSSFFFLLNWLFF